MSTGESNSAANSRCSIHRHSRYLRACSFAAFFIYAIGLLLLSRYIAIQQQQSSTHPTHGLQTKCPVSRIHHSANVFEQRSKTQTKKVLVAVAHVQTPSLASRQHRHLLSTRHDPAQPKARDRSPQRSFTVLTRIMAIASSHLATRVTCAHPTISWRRAGHPLHHDTGQCLQNQMLPKVSVRSSLIPPHSDQWELVRLSSTYAYSPSSNHFLPTFSPPDPRDTFDWP